MVLLSKLFLQGRTPLHKAAFRGHSTVAEILLAKGASIDATDGIGRGLRGSHRMKMLWQTQWSCAIFMNESQITREVSNSWGCWMVARDDTSRFFPQGSLKWWAHPALILFVHMLFIGRGHPARGFGNWSKKRAHRKKSNTSNKSSKNGNNKNDKSNNNSTNNSESQNNWPWTEFKQATCSSCGKESRRASGASRFRAYGNGCQSSQIWVAFSQLPTLMDYSELFCYPEYLLFPR